MAPSIFEGAAPRSGVGGGARSLVEDFLGFEGEPGGLLCVLWVLDRPVSWGAASEIRTPLFPMALGVYPA